MEKELVQKERLNVTASPHFKSKNTTRRIMLDVIIALSPALIMSVVLFSFRSLLVTAVCVASCVLFEYLTRKIFKRHNTLPDLSAVVTGLLLAFNLPVTTPLWMIVVGSFAAIVVAKQFFGGIGQNFVNPALIGRIVMFVSFPAAMTKWTPAFSHNADAVTTASPLALISKLFESGDVSHSALSSAKEMPSLLDMLFGIRAGCIGEVCILALLAGGIYLVCRKVISPVIPLVYLFTVAVIMLIAGKGSFSYVAYELMGGGLVLGALFMATDYSTSPINFKGKIIFALGCGVLTAVIRLFGSMNEGVSFSIVLMNILVPLIERLTVPKAFGLVKEKKEKKQKSLSDKNKEVEVS